MFAQILGAENGKIIAYLTPDFTAHGMNITPLWQFGGEGIHTMLMWIETAGHFHEDKQQSGGFLNSNLAAQEAPSAVWGAAYFVQNLLYGDDDKKFTDEHFYWGGGHPVVPQLVPGEKDGWAGMWTFPMGIPRGVGLYTLHMEGKSPDGTYRTSYQIEVRDWAVDRIDLLVPSGGGGGSNGGGHNSGGGGSETISKTPEEWEVVRTSGTTTYFDPSAGQKAELKVHIKTIPPGWAAEKVAFRLLIYKEGAAVLGNPKGKGVVYKAEKIVGTRRGPQFEISHLWDGKADRSWGKVKAGQTVPGGRYVAYWESIQCDKPLEPLQAIGPVFSMGKIALEELKVTPTIFDPSKGPCEISTRVLSKDNKNQGSNIDDLRVWLEILNTRDELDDQPLVDPEGNRARRVWERADFALEGSQHGDPPVSVSVLSPLSLKFTWDGQDKQPSEDQTVPLEATSPVQDEPYILKAARKGPVDMGPYTTIPMKQACTARAMRVECSLSSRTLYLRGSRSC